MPISSEYLVTDIKMAPRQPEEEPGDGGDLWLLLPPAGERRLLHAAVREARLCSLLAGDLHWS